MAEPTSSTTQPLSVPKGTRDFYPIEMARRRWIEDKWRKVAVRHGFEEIDGPTFEETELYTRKSGDGIVGEIFGVYSGKDEASVKAMGERLARGERGAIAPFALRPEFTPTLARMYAARAKQLPQPCKWFWQGPCYRAERPQRGRLREFWQWNCDVIGVAGGGGGGGNANAEVAEVEQRKTEADAEVIACCVDLLRACGLSADTIKVRISDRTLAAELLVEIGVPEVRVPEALGLIDRADKMPPEVHGNACAQMGFTMELFRGQAQALEEYFNLGAVTTGGTGFGDRDVNFDLRPMHGMFRSLRDAAMGDWLRFDMKIARGLAYYTGMVFEVIVDGERAVAGGGRYDNLIETFGGPPTPAVGFGMGDVVLSLVLQDKGLMPTDAQIARDLGLRPDVFVISNGTSESDAQVGPLLAHIRRAGMHARRSYKSTKNIGKLLKEASDAGSRYAVIVESATDVTLKNLDDNTQEKGPREAMLERIKPIG